MLPLGTLPLTGTFGPELTNVGLQMDRAVFANVVSVVRSKISDWAIKLKKAGIMGDGFSFSEPEKRKARDSTVHIHIGHIGHLTGGVGEISGSPVISSKTGVNSLDLVQVKSLLTQLREINGLPNNENREIQRQTAALLAEIKREHPEQSRIVEGLRSIRTVAEGVVGNLIAAGVVTWINRLLSS